MEYRRGKIERGACDKVDKTLPIDQSRKIPVKRLNLFPKPDAYYGLAHNVTRKAEMRSRHWLITQRHFE